MMIGREDSTPAVQALPMRAGCPWIDTYGSEGRGFEALWAHSSDRRSDAGAIMVDVMGPRGDLPTGTVTFLFSDIEGSTRLVQRLGDRFVGILESQQGLLREAFREH